MTRVLVAPGPEPHLLGTREPEIYGTETLDEIHAGIAARAAELGLEVDFFQSNHEGALIDRLHARDFDVAIVNAAGLTHTSVSLRDALTGDRSGRSGRSTSPTRGSATPFRKVNFLHDVAPRRPSWARARAAITWPSSRSPSGSGAPRERRRDGNGSRPHRPTNAERDDAALELAGSATGSTSWTSGSSSCSTSGPSSAATRGARRRSRAGGRSATPSASARCCCASRWPTAGR